MLNEEQKLDAAEYVLGTLSAAERVAFAASMKSDPELAVEVAVWQRLLSGLALAVPEQDVDPALRARLEEEIGRPSVTAGSAQAPAREEFAQTATSVQEPPAPPANDNSEVYRRSVGRWRFAAIAASLAAAMFAGLYYVESTNEALTRSGEDYIAVVNANADQPALIVKIDGQTGDVRVRPLGMERPDGKSLELWYVPEGETAVSVGLVGEGDIDLGALSAKPGDLLAISLEPQGGSPTGTATGPVIYTGKLVEDVETSGK